MFSHTGRAIPVYVFVRDVVLQCYNILQLQLADHAQQTMRTRCPRHCKNDIAINREDILFWAEAKDTGIIGDGKLWPGQNIDSEADDRNVDASL